MYTIVFVLMCMIVATKSDTYSLLNLMLSINMCINFHKHIASMFVADHCTDRFNRYKTVVSESISVNNLV